MEGKLLKVQSKFENKQWSSVVSVEKHISVVGHLPKEKIGRFTKTFVCIFLRASDENSCHAVGGSAGGSAL